MSRKIVHIKIDEGVDAFFDRISETSGTSVCYLIKGAETNYLIDCLSGAAGASLINFLPKDKKPLIILLTHLHADHAGGLNDFLQEENVQVYVHEKGVECLNNPPDGICDEDKVKENKRVYKTMKTPTWTRTARALSDGMVFDINDSEQIHCIYTPGHTATAVCFHIPQRNYLFTGDAYYYTDYSELKKYAYGSTEDISESLKKILEKVSPGAKIFTGHPRLRRPVLDYETFAESVKEILDAIAEETPKRQKCVECNIYTNLVCGQCKTTFYCGTICQSKNWPIHSCFLK